jgi:hypothetical protein
VIDMRYENPLYMAEEAAAADLLAGGRLQLGVSRGSPEPAWHGAEAFGYSLDRGQRLLEARHDWSDLADYSRLANAFWWGVATYAARSWQLNGARHGGERRLDSFELPGNHGGVELARDIKPHLYGMLTGDTLTLLRASGTTAVIRGTFFTKSVSGGNSGQRPYQTSISLLSTNGASLR